ncbi:hypothetical protein CRM22_005238 [Opisthorchis felineus]|nr:hypothetical protein CRM22_005238 [Opisthorchis felineus]
MFMLEYSIAVQNAELERLKELAESEEKKLNMAEQCLEQDAALFDEFLKDNDKSSIEAITNAEQEARRRSAMIDEIRQLSVQQQKLTAENNRLRSVVQEYRGYKLFLECLVPEPHRSGRQIIRQERRLAKEKAREEARRKLTVQLPLSGMFELCAEADNSVLERHHQELKESIRVEEEKSKDFSVTSQDFVGFEKKGQEAVLQELHNHIGEVYRTCIQKPDASLSSLQLLSEIESKMIALLQQISELPEGAVKAALHARERKHRLDVKERRRQEQQKHQEERLRKTLERAQAEPKMMHGRKIVARSEPPKMSKDDSKDLEALAKEEEEMRVLFG